MDVQSAIPLLEREWELFTGSLGRLRSGDFDRDAIQKLIELLQSVDTGDTRVIDKRFVSLTWYIPLFMNWQRERVVENGGNIDELIKAINTIEGLLEDILGTP